MKFLSVILPTSLSLGYKIKDKGRPFVKKKHKHLKSLSLVLILYVLMSCNQSNQTHQSNDSTSTSDVMTDKNTFYQYNIWWGFVNKVFDGDLTVKELKTKGDIGLGSYTKLEGELVMLDGIPYRIREDGSVSVPEDEDKIVYVDAAFFEPEFSFELNQQINFDSLRELINGKLPTKNQFYAFTIKGDFNYLKCGGLTRQEKPYTDGLDVLIPARPVFERENFPGTIVGFYCPEFIGNINVAGYHFHFISDDKTFGGHVMELEAESLTVQVDPLLDYHFTLPDTEDFFNVSLDKEFQYEKK